jgi:hypothetical protein
MWESGKSGTEKRQTNRELGISISSPYPRVPEFHIQILAGPWHSPEEQCRKGAGTAATDLRGATVFQMFGKDLDEFCIQENYFQ